MPRVLHHLLGRDDRLFYAGLDKLEKVVGGAGIEARLVVDVTHGAHAILRALSLDHTNTTAREAYAVLRAHVERDDRMEALLATDYIVVSFESEVVSFNLLDILEDIHEGRAYARRTLVHGRRALLGELTHRYLEHGSTHDSTVRDLLADLDAPPRAKPKKATLPPLHHVQKH